MQEVSKKNFRNPQPEIRILNMGYPKKFLPSLRDLIQSARRLTQAEDDLLSWSPEQTTYLYAVENFKNCLTDAFVTPWAEPICRTLANFLEDFHSIRRHAKHMRRLRKEYRLKEHCRRQQQLLKQKKVSK